MFNMKQKMEFMEAFRAMQSAGHHVVDHKTYDLGSYAELNLDVLAYLAKHPEDTGKIILGQMYEWEVPKDEREYHPVMIAMYNGAIINLTESGVLLVHGTGNCTSSFWKGVRRTTLNQRLIEAFIKKRTFHEFHQET